MQTFNIKVKYAKEVFIPIGAISSNIEFLSSAPDQDRCVVTSDGKIAKILSRKSVNVLSDEGSEIFGRIYEGFRLEKILREYYKRLDGIMSSLEFQYMELGEPMEDKEW